MAEIIIGTSVCYRRGYVQYHDSNKRSCLISVSNTFNDFCICCRKHYIFIMSLEILCLCRLSGSTLTKSFQFGLYLLCWSPISWDDAEPAKIIWTTVMRVGFSPRHRPAMWFSEFLRSKFSVGSFHTVGVGSPALGQNGLSDARITPKERSVDFANRSLCHSFAALL